MSDRGSERDWLRSASVPEPFTTTRQRLTRKDVWEHLDWLERRLVEADLLLASDVRRRFVNLRSMLATLLPPDRQRLACTQPGCARVFDSQSALSEHVSYDHGHAVAR